MKSSEIIDHILNLPKYRPVKAANEASRVLTLLGKERSSQIRFAYQKNGVLFIAVGSALGLVELRNDSNIFLIKNFLNRYIEANSTTSLTPVSDIKIFIAKTSEEYSGHKRGQKGKIDPQNVMLTEAFVPIPGSILKSEPARFSEKSTGNFKNLANDPAIKAAFEMVRQSILKILATQNSEASNG